MKIEWSEKTPRKIQQFPNPDYPSDNPELEDVLTSADGRADISDAPDGLI